MTYYWVPLMIIKCTAWLTVMFAIRLANPLMWVTSLLTTIEILLYFCGLFVLIEYRNYLVADEDKKR